MATDCVLASSLYGYARGYANVPAAGTIQIYANLAQKLMTELDNPHRQSVVDRVIFNTASDSFQTHPKVLTDTFDAMKVLLERGIAISFLTKGRIPGQIYRSIGLLRRSGDGLSRFRFGFETVSKTFRSMWFLKPATKGDLRLLSMMPMY